MRNLSEVGWNTSAGLLAESIAVFPCIVWRTDTRRWSLECGWLIGEEFTSANSVVASALLSLNVVVPGHSLLTLPTTNNETFK